VLTKDFNFDIKALDADTGTFEGYASVFENVDSDGDVIERGAFAESLREWQRKGKPIPVLWQHNPHEPIGVTESAVEDGRGLAVKGRLLMGIQRAKEAYEAARAKVVSGLSIGFSIPAGATSWDAAAKVRRIRRLNLWEYSWVTFPSNSEAQIVGVKSEDAGELLRQVRALAREVREYSEHSSLRQVQAQVARLRDEFRGRQ
jgi:HK97 family phage prohead protease